MADRLTDKDRLLQSQRTGGTRLRVDIPRPRRRRLSIIQSIIIAGVLAAAVCAMVWGFLAELPAGPEFGTKLEGSFPVAQPFPARIRLANYNIHGGRGRDGRKDLGRIAHNLQGIHFAGLNEVHDPGTGNTPGQAELLGRELQSNWLFAPTEWCWRGEHFGSAAVSHLPVDYWQRIPLENKKAAGYRNLILFRIPLPQGKLHVVVTHLDRDKDREMQLRGVLDFFRSLEQPAILMGDLNTPRHDPILRQAIDSGAVQDCISSQAKEDLPNRIDWILSRGISSVSAGLIDEGASDHPLVWAEFNVKSAAP
ncbi:MAG: hypothetical protein U0903_07855 [Planctomycetales bacterium]